MLFAWINTLFYFMTHLFEVLDTIIQNCVPF